MFKLRSNHVSIGPG